MVAYFLNNIINHCFDLKCDSIICTVAIVGKFGGNKVWQKWMNKDFGKNSLANYYRNLPIIVTATITFSKRKGEATKRGWLLYEGGL